jgi:hypothetical protein
MTHILILEVLTHQGESTHEKVQKLRLRVELAVEENPTRVYSKEQNAKIFPKEKRAPASFPLFEGCRTVGWSRSP